MSKGKYTTYDLPCPHEQGDAPHGTKVSDYHPLTYGELRTMLQVAQTSTDPRERNSIQIRLTQAIPGFSCPRAIDGPVAQKELWLIEQFIAHRRAGDLPDMVDEFFALM